MIRAKLCFAASGIVRDAETNVISAFNVLEGITAAGFPLFIQAMSFVALWEREPGDPAAIEATFTLSIGEEQLSTGQVLGTFGGKLRYRTIVNINGVVVPHPGNLRFLLQLATGETAEYVVDVEAQPAAVQVQAQ
jgi:hypothetical protein